AKIAVEAPVVEERDDHDGGGDRGLRRPPQQREEYEQEHDRGSDGDPERQPEHAERDLRLVVLVQRDDRKGSEQDGREEHRCPGRGLQPFAHYAEFLNGWDETEW